MCSLKPDLMYSLTPNSSACISCAFSQCNQITEVAQNMFYMKVFRQIVTHSRNQFVCISVCGFAREKVEDSIRERVHQREACAKTDTCPCQPDLSGRAQVTVQLQCCFVTFGHELPSEESLYLPLGLPFGLAQPVS